MQDGHTDRLFLSREGGGGGRQQAPGPRSLSECQQPPAMRSSWGLVLYLSFRHIQFILTTAVRRGHHLPGFTDGDTEARQQAQLCPTPEQSFPPHAGGGHSGGRCRHARRNSLQDKGQGGRHGAKQWSQVCKGALCIQHPRKLHRW